ncbi:hydrolase [Leptospira mtsangambouensis]|uniref:Hydrolase n=1 Tax=Leptospira mtsangambouensis TaxID=2484912 RepID=A0ABY2P1P9_9LEPT|nr:GDSL-type esterase/lipase family protein [Leptospira mtsangambouensis]TGM81371.1 hydrolase [Leptospira mtsangambouensis]
MKNKNQKIKLLLLTITLLLTFNIEAQTKNLSYDITKPVLIRPFGDSITYGFGFTDWGFCPVSSIGQFICMPPNQAVGGYRVWMTEFAITNKAFIFTTEGYQSGGSNPQQWITNTQTHDGYPGWRNDQLLQIANYASFADITLVHAGTNDLIQGKSPNNAMTDLFKVVNALLAKNPKTQVFLAKIIRISPAAATILPNYETLSTNIREYNQLIETNWINTVPSLRSRITLVDMHPILGLPEDYYDNVHPSPLGYMKISCTWINAIKNQKTNPSDPCYGLNTDQIKSKITPSEQEIQKMQPTKEELDKILNGKFELK